MKRLLDRAVGLILGIIAIYVGFAIAADLVQPYIGKILTVVAIVAAVGAAVFVLPPLLGMGSSLTERLRNGRWEQS